MIGARNARNVDAGADVAPVETASERVRSTQRRAA